MIAERLNQFLKHLGVTAYQFEKEVGLSKNSIAIAIKNNTTIGSEALGKIFSKHSDINLEWLISGEGKMLKENSIKNISQKENTHLINTPIHTPNSKSKDLGVFTYKQNEGDTLSSSIPVKVMDIEAAASITGAIAGTHPDEFGVMHLPDTLLKRNHNYYAFKVKNESMHPTLYHGDHVIGAHIPSDSWDTLKDNYIYIISSKNDGVYIKRIKNRLREQGFIRCRSDNRSFNSFSIPHSEVVSIFEVVCKISFNLPNEAKTLYEAISRLEDRMDDIETKYNPKP